MTEKVKDQIEQVRRGGRVNMLDTNGVQVVANDENLYDLVIFIEENRKAYAEYILTGVSDNA